MAEYSKYQQNIIKNYYDNRENIALQRLQELVTELYLADGKKADRYWQQVATHLSRLGVKQPRIDHLLKQRKPELVATLLEQLLGN